jgi:hypothetical protein
VAFLSPCDSYEVNLPPGGFTLDIDEVEGTVAHVSAMGCRLP